MFRGIWKASPVLRRTTFAWWINPFRSWSQTRNSEKAWLSSSSSMASYHESTLCHSIFRSLPTENTTVSYTYIYIYLCIYKFNITSQKKWTTLSSLGLFGLPRFTMMCRFQLQSQIFPYALHRHNAGFAVRSHAHHPIQRLGDRQRVRNG